MSDLYCYKVVLDICTEGGIDHVLDQIQKLHNENPKDDEELILIYVKSVSDPV